MPIRGRPCVPRPTTSSVFSMDVRYLQSVGTCAGPQAFP
jgi:hypothetical protein